MRGKYIRSYRNKKGNLVFVYKVSGNTEQLDQFKKAQGDYYREDDDKNPLFFSPRYAGEAADIRITSQGRAILDTSKFDQADSLAKQYGGNLGQELARIAAQQLTGLGPVVTDTQPVVNDNSGPIDGL